MYVLIVANLGLSLRDLERVFYGGQFLKQLLALRFTVLNFLDRHGLAGPQLLQLAAKPVELFFVFLAAHLYIGESSKVIVQPDMRQWLPLSLTST